jgi:hypothetical protein
LWVEPSISKSDLGGAIETAFQLVDNGGVVSQRTFMWAAENPF